MTFDAIRVGNAGAGCRSLYVSVTVGQQSNLFGRGK